ncbi:unnamed protein product [Protopolystoma xenopodis]|uniref:Uncharacterized protein n=1 Tax=Protopolystoma xenopodis TaxID=117903 RepID=A0A448XC73_9PLAT|nr:unnamed protein product [Protopolystoma xenopodis]
MLLHFYFSFPPFYPSYAMYYENIIKNQHCLLYSKEREIEDLREQLKQKDIESDVTVHFQMSEQAHNLLLGESAGVVRRIYFILFSTKNNYIPIG